MSPHTCHGSLRSEHCVGMTPDSGGRARTVGLGSKILRLRGQRYGMPDEGERQVVAHPLSHGRWRTGDNAATFWLALEHLD